MTSVDLNRLLSWPFLLAIIGHGLAVLQGPLVWVLAAQHAVPLTVLVVAAIALGDRGLPAAHRARSTALRCAWASVVTTGAVVLLLGSAAGRVRFWSRSRPLPLESS